MAVRLSDMGPTELLDFVQRETILEGQATEILRNPYCTAEIAEMVAQTPGLLSSHRICALVCTVEGMPLSRVVDLMVILPWGPLMQLTQAPRTPPAVRRLAERRLLHRLPKMTLGEKIALARRAHRALFPHLIGAGDEEVFLALLDNPRLTEADLVSLLNTRPPTPGVVTALLRNSRWSCRRGIMVALARCPGAPLPLVLSALAQLPRRDLQELARDPRVSNQVREQVKRLVQRRGGVSAGRVVR
ncbi:MAG: hypothetical protein K8R59_16265 [Thermoanaerobaculales bacterium]|nr:hypothetical protein [Thermoanaerobaculales bacterium]